MKENQTGMFTLAMEEVTSQIKALTDRFPRTGVVMLSAETTESGVDFCVTSVAGNHEQLVAALGGFLGNPEHTRLMTEAMKKGISFRLDRITGKIDEFTNNIPNIKSNGKTN